MPHMRGSCVSGGPATAETPCLPLGDGLSHVAPLPPTRRLTTVRAHTKEQARRDDAEAAKAALRRSGKRWRDAREWALVWIDDGSTRWTPAEINKHVINPDVVTAYVATLTEEAGVSDPSGQA